VNSPDQEKPATIALGEGEACGSIPGSRLVVGIAVPRSERHCARLSDTLDREDARDISTHGRKEGVAFRDLCCVRGARLGGVFGDRSGGLGCPLLWLGALPAWAPAMLYSLEAIASFGHARIYLADRWELLGAIEAVNGLILLGLTTAFLFAAIQQVWVIWRD
jgi:hypothetical protein